MNFGFKWTLFTGANTISTVQLRMWIPTASASGLGTKHVTFEPAFLFNYRMFEFLNVEGEFRYWAPVGGTEFAGITDPNYRIFADRDGITVFNNERFVRGTNVQDIFAQPDVDDDDTKFVKARKASWARLIRRIYEADPAPVAAPL